MKIKNRTGIDYFSTIRDGKRFIIILVVLFLTSLLYYFPGISDYFISDSLVGLSLK